MKKIVVLLVVLLGCMSMTAFAQKQFFFKDGRFVIAQFTDLHWTPQSPKCAGTAATIRAVLKAERPDFAVLSGDVVTDDSAIEGWKAMVGIFDEAEVPFVVTMGNHDAEYMAKDAIYDLEMTNKKSLSPILIEDNTIESKAYPYMAHEINNKDIAINLSISERTVKNHISNIFKKITVEDRTQAAVFAIKNNIIKIH